MAEDSPREARDDGDASSDDAIASAEAARDRLRSRAEWWEEHKGQVLFPSMILGLVAGYLVGASLEDVVKVGQLSRWFGAVIGLLFVGRIVASVFDPRRLVAAQKRVDALRASRRRGR